MIRRRALPVAAILLVLALTGCAVPMGQPVASLENIGKARAARLPPLALGTFSLAPDKPAAMDQKVMLRVATLHSPYGGSFAAYLKETLATDLRAAGLLDPQSPTVVSGELTDSDLSVPVGTASATVAARFTVKRAGTTLYAKELRARADWQAEFNGFEALPMAVNRYEQAYRQLTGTLLGDPEFRAALVR